VEFLETHGNNIKEVWINNNVADKLDEEHKSDNEDNETRNSEEEKEEEENKEEKKIANKVISDLEVYHN